MEVKTLPPNIYSQSRVPKSLSWRVRCTLSDFQAREKAETRFAHDLWYISYLRKSECGILVWEYDDYLIPQGSVPINYFLLQTG